MATHYSSQVTKNKQVDDLLPLGSVRVAFGTYTAGAELAAGTIIQLVKVPAGAVILNIILKWSAMGASAAYDLGDGGDVDRYFDGLDTSAAGFTSLVSSDGEAAGGFHTYTAADTIDLKVLVTAMPDEAAVSCAVEYYIPE